MITRYELPEMANLWTDKHKFEVWWKIEYLALKAMAEFELIPASDFKKIQENITIDADRITEIETQVKHDMIAFTKTISEQLGPEQRWIHFGLTSSDILDTSLAYITREANELINQKFWNLLRILKKMALKYKDTPIIGRTHGMFAELTTFGFKVAVWYDVMMCNYQHFCIARESIETGKLAGPVGTYSNIDPRIQEYVCEQLNLNSAKIATQVIQRDRHARYIENLSVTASCIEMLATELRHLQRSEINEVAEGFSVNQKGSSSMPHKQNPITAENICGLARIIRGYSIPALENINLWHERDISHSSVERLMFPDVISLFYFILDKTCQLLTNLEIKPEVMQNNIDKSQHLIFSQAVMLKLIASKAWSREQAYDFVQKATLTTLEKKIDFQKALLLANVPLTQQELRECFDPSRSLRHIDTIFQRLNISQTSETDV